MRTAAQQSLIDRLRGYAAEVQAKAPIKRRRAIRTELEGDPLYDLYLPDRLTMRWPPRFIRDIVAAVFRKQASEYEAEWPIEEERMPRLSWPVEDGEALVNPDNLFGANPEMYAPIGYSGHPGIDFMVPVGTPVMAAGDGYVTAAHDAGTAGYMVRIQHDGCATRYCHLSEWHCNAGDEVTAGQVIGLSGGRPGDPGAGYTTGEHLHVDVWDDNEPLDNGYGGRTDPLLWFTVDPETVLA